MFKKKIKFIILVSISIVMVVSLLAGCGKENDVVDTTDEGKIEKTDEDKIEEPVIITFAGWGDAKEKEVFTKLVRDFEKKNTNIKVEYTQISADYVGKMNVMIAGGTAPDVFYVPDGDFPRWARIGAIASIQEYIEKSQIDLDDMWDSALIRYRFDGTITGVGDLYCLPKDIGPTVIYYNKDLFDKANVQYPPSDRAMDWDEFLEVAQKMTIDEDNDGTPEQYGMGPIWWEGFVWSNGGEILSEDHREFLMNSPNAIEAMQFAADLGNKYNVTPDSRALQSMNDGQMFETGRLAMMIQGRWMVPTYRELDFDWDVTLIPAGKTGESSGWSGSVGIGINAKSLHKDAAFKLLEYLGGLEGQKYQAEMGFAIPSFKSIANTDVFLQPDKRPKSAGVFIIAAEKQRPGPWTALPSNKWFDILNQNLGKLWEGEETAAELFSRIEEDVNNAIKEGNPEIFE